MRFALFALVAALTVATVSAMTFTPVTHSAHEASASSFRTYTNGNVPSQQYLGWFNGAAQGPSTTNAAQTVSVYNVRSASRNSSTKAFNTLSAPYGSWSEVSLGADANYAVSVNVQSPWLNSSTSSNAGFNVDNPTSPGAPATNHYAFGASGISTGAVFAEVMTISDSLISANINSSSSLFAYINLVDTPSNTLYLGVRPSSSSNMSMYLPLLNEYVATATTWMTATGPSSSGQVRVTSDAAGTVVLADWVTVSTQPNGLFAFIVYGSIDPLYKAAFPVQVGLFKASSQTGSPAATVSVEVALMAVLAILAFATPALF